MSLFPKSTAEFDIFNVKLCHFVSNKTNVAVSIVYETDTLV